MDKELKEAIALIKQVNVTYHTPELGNEYQVAMKMVLDFVESYLACSAAKVEIRSEL
jgi:hypothetical protein